MIAIVVGIGQRAAGDDAIGLVVADALAARGVDARACADASVVLGLLAGGHRVVIVDAVVGGGPPGSVRALSVDELAAGAAPLSSHGLGVADALALARTLYGEPDVAIVGIAIAAPSHDRTLTPEVEAAVEPAVALALQLAGQ